MALKAPYIMQLSEIMLVPHIYHAEGETLVKDNFAVDHLPWRKSSRERPGDSYSSSAKSRNSLVSGLLSFRTLIMTNLGSHVMGGIVVV